MAAVQLPGSSGAPEGSAGRGKPPGEAKGEPGVDSSCPATFAPTRVPDINFRVGPESAA